jgi:hypothetical protein
VRCGRPAAPSGRSVVPRDSWHLRGGEGGQGGLERVPQASQGARAHGRPADHPRMPAWDSPRAPPSSSPRAAWQRCIVGSLKKWPSRRLGLASVAQHWATVGRRYTDRDRSQSSQPAHKRSKESGCQPLQIDGCGGQIGLNAHVRQAAPDSAGKSIPGFCFAMEAFRPPAVPLLDPSILLTPSITAASCPEQSGIVVADARPFDRQSPLNGRRAQSLALE